MSLVKLCGKGDLEGVKAALQSGADVNSKDENGETGLMWAVCFEHNSVVELLLNTPNIDVNWKSDWAQCALYFAVSHQNNEALKLLLNVPNIDVNIVDNHRWSAVHVAAAERNIEALKLLLRHPSLTALTLNQKGKCQGATPVMVAALLSNRLEQLELLATDPRVDLDTTDQEGRSLEEVLR